MADFYCPFLTFPSPFPLLTVGLKMDEKSVGKKVNCSKQKISIILPTLETMIKGILGFDL